MNIQKDNVIKIGNILYDVLSVLEEIDSYDAEKKEFVGEHTSVDLHKRGDASLHATHRLKIYSEEKVYLLSIKGVIRQKRISYSDISVVK